MEKFKLTPLFQLNFLIHLSLPYPDNSIFYPYFNRKGFKVKQIEQSIPLEKNSVKKLNKVFASKKMVTPEVVLYNDESKEYLLVECKVKPFNLDWNEHSTQQAAGYMSLSIDYLKWVFALQQKHNIKAQLIYSVEQGKEEEMFNTLTAINNTVQQILGYAMKYDAFGIGVKSDGIYLNFVNNKEAKNIKVANEKILSNHAVLYIIPVDINGQLDEENKHILETQVRNTLRSIIGKNVGPRSFSFNSIEICKKINPIWEQLPTHFKKKMKRWVHNYIKQVIEKISSMGIKVHVHEQNYSFPAINEQKTQAIRKFLISEKFIETGQDIFSEFEQITIDEFLDVV
ncbi:hypothetical protein B0I26_12123 [Anoxybacillus vitaminiphilus]|uniref:Uncharacterized protein n=1 Tax=Paranoxybacillus vitaminiphilus TaxID=581036 RepID=A0A327Y362_9BACL|nr:hypothetical protein [Anoxybacillus vitaminiphilus]RAK15453.1 hypothetical protein B0I26_12123 [Anoxybacillus vitaminiphilus]